MERGFAPKMRNLFIIICRIKFIAHQRLSVSSANVKKKVGQCLKKIRPPALEKNQATWPQNA